MKNRELHESRLGTTDEKGRRVMPQPEEVKGRWSSRRHIFQWALILFYLVLPWIVVDGRQWVRLDIPKREFTLFGSIFYAHDSVYLIFALLGFMLLIAFVTSVWGRVWCGWACPQTVFIELVYRKIETLVEGNARKRKALNRQPMNFGKLFKKSLKWALYLIVTLHIVHSFLGYFVGTRELVEITLQSPSKNWTLFVIMVILSGLTLFDFGWFREQVCIIACPYGRFQSVLMDENSLVVAYDEKRGEPRRGPEVPSNGEGDCINCFKCVKVCPTGIDIRRGNQMECIACTLCVDACDDIMRKVGKDEGLIRYSSETELAGGKRKVGMRSFIYLTLLALVGTGGIFALEKRKALDPQFLRMKGAPFTLVVDEGNELVLNRFQAKVETVGRKGLSLGLKISDPYAQKVELISGELPMEIAKDKVSFSFFVKLRRNLFAHGSFLLPVEIQVFKDGELIETKKQEVKLVGPL